VLFSHDTELALQGAVVLANSALPPDTMTTVEDLDAWYEEFLFSGRRDGDDRELQQVRALRPALYELFTSDRDEAADIVNRMLEKARALPQLVRHEPFDWHIHAVSPAAPLVTRITVETAMAMIDLIRADEMSRLSVCADDDCDGVVLDLSRNRSRRFCSTACGNRNAVAAYRARRAASSTRADTA
jgi:predicted RNA-binding Zn ribbon-like protein